MQRKRLLAGAIAGILVCLLVVSLVADTVGNYQGTLWGNLETAPGYIGAGFGGEFVFVPVRNFGIETGFSKQDYGLVITDHSFGIRGILPRGSLGTGLKLTILGDPSNLLTKGYFWGSLYGPNYFLRAYFDATQKMNYGTISLSADVWTPLGFSVSYLNNTVPSGQYEELKGDISLSLLGACQQDSEYDVRIFFGGKASCFVTPTYQRYEWYGVVGGMRILFPKGSLRFGIGLPSNLGQKAKVFLNLSLGF